MTSTLGEHNERQRGYREGNVEAGLMPEFLELGFRPSLGIKREVLYRYFDERADSPEPVDAVFASTIITPRWRWAGARARYSCTGGFPGDWLRWRRAFSCSCRSWRPWFSRLRGMAERTAQRLLELIELQQEDSLRRPLPQLPSPRMYSG